MVKWNLIFKPHQLKVYASAASNIGQAIILFSLAAFFFPKVVSLPADFSREIAASIFFGGFILIIGAGIIMPED